MLLLLPKVFDAHAHAQLQRVHIKALMFTTALEHSGDLRCCSTVRSAQQPFTCNTRPCLPSPHQHLLGWLCLDTPAGTQLVAFGT